MAGEALYYGTGRRKNAVARVRIVPGTGKVTVNGREGVEYFGREALLDYAKAPFKVTDTVGHFDVKATINGGGISGQAGALRHGIARALLEAGDYRAAVSYTHLSAGYQPEGGGGGICTEANLANNVGARMQGASYSCA